MLLQQHYQDTLLQVSKPEEDISKLSTQLETEAHATRVWNQSPAKSTYQKIWNQATYMHNNNCQMGLCIVQMKFTIR